MHEKTRSILAGVAALAAVGGVTAGIAGAAKERGAKTERHAPEATLTGDAKDGGRPGHGGPGGPCDHHGTPLTGDHAEQARAAVLAELPGAEILKAFAQESAEAEDAKYEVHAMRADGTPAEVLLDSDFKVLKVLDRPAFGHRGPGGPGGPPHADALTGETLEKASAAAKDAVAGGTVRGAFAAGDRAPENAKYVVLVSTKNGRPVMVLLDAEFAVVKKVAPRRGGPGRPGHGFGTGGPPPA